MFQAKYHHSGSRRSEPYRNISPFEFFKDVLNIDLFYIAGELWRAGLIASDEFAKKNDLPILDFLLWPRLGAFRDLVDKRVGITHILDVTIFYPWQFEGILDYFLNFTKTTQIYYYNRIFEIIEEDHCGDENSQALTVMKSGTDQHKLVRKSKVLRSQLDKDWLFKIWMEKEALMDEFFSDQDTFLSTHPPRKIPRNLWMYLSSRIFFSALTCILILSLFTGFRFLFSF